MEAYELFLLGIVVGLGFFMWFLYRRSQCLFLIRIRNKNVHLKSGKVSPAFIKDCQRICDIHGILKGEVTGVRNGTDVKLNFSRDLQRYKQPFRNSWNCQNYG